VLPSPPPGASPDAPDLARPSPEDAATTPFVRHRIALVVALAGSLAAAPGRAERLGGTLGGGGYCVEVAEGTKRALVWVDVGDKTLKEQFENLAGRRVVVECRGEYKLGSRKAEKHVNSARPAEEVPVLMLTLTAETIAAAQ
jgi:hypothetical protein